MTSNDDPWWGDDAEVGLDLAAERDAPHPPSAARARVLAGVMGRVGPGAPGGPGSAPAEGPPSGPAPFDPAGGASASATATTGASSGAAWMLGGLVLALAVVGLYLSVGGEHDAPVGEPTPAAIVTPPAPPPIASRSADATTATADDAQPIAEPPAPVAAPAAEPVAEVTPAPRARAPHHPLPRAVEPPSAAPPAPQPPSALAREQALLREARAALRKGDFAGTAAGIERHATEFARGQLAEAREVLRIQLLVRQGRPDDARAAVRRFRARFPESLMGPALEDAAKAPLEDAR